MADEKKAQSGAPIQEEVVYVPLKTFADTHATKYGIELMAGFYHEHETKNHFHDTEENWHRLIQEFAKREVR